MKYFAPISLAAALVGASPMAYAANVQVTTQNPVIELSISEQIDSRPDTATFSTGVETKAPTATQAMRDNSRQAKVVIDKLKSLGIAEKDIQTTGINLNADYEYDRTSETNRFVGYRVSNQVQATVRNIDKLGTILDSLVSSGGATNLSGPYFSLDDDVAIKKLARERALISGKQRAESYAKASGYSGVRVISISEAMSNNSLGPMPVSRMAAVQEKSVPVAPGQVGTTINLNISYEMTR
ncbi:MAG: SIMPL domain-containing protein [Parasphingorhabdus sp.]|uniref:SIMPL domain-containing protein n=1 Tax=Parasphingorhabdus sp. TaxID=2709688 RepID=UPI003002D163